MGWCFSNSNNSKPDTENKAALRSNGCYKVLFSSILSLPVFFSFTKIKQLTNVEHCTFYIYIINHLWNKIHNLCMQQHGNCTTISQFIHIAGEYTMFSSLEIVLFHKSYLYLNQQFCLSSFQIRPGGNPTPWLSKSLVSSAVVFQSYSQ